ncbi:MAG: glycoside hydrolase family 16 protein [Mycoplasmataceae bacterium]|nr:glycoside hydrolase family 16 protein [Mycoplasmataceae bacterium]
MVKIFRAIVSIVPMVAVIALSCTSCGISQYTNIDDVLSCKNGWYKTLSSDFSKGTMPDKWAIRGDHEARDCGGETFYWDNDEVSFPPSTDHLKINYEQKASELNTTGCIETKTTETDPGFNQAFGYWEVDCKLLQEQYGWSAFWLQCNGESQVGNGGRDGSEIDILESLYYIEPKNTVRITTHCDGYDDTPIFGHHKEFYKIASYTDSGNQPISFYDGNYHKFGLLWTPERYYMYVDRHLVMETDGGGVVGICQVPVYAILSGHMGPGGNNFGYENIKFSDYTEPGEFDIRSFNCYQNSHFEKYIRQTSDFS